ncbi:MAG TPA: hypothetical protein VKV39_02065 [Candidatus Sulfotelmatobacter sp.]|nr:hypothetical protein [Candidatus Sulfotelmatobacter sp.]
MKIRTGSVAILIFLLASAAAAQTKLTATLHCPKPRALATEPAGDEAGHMMTLEKSTCTWLTPFEMAGERATEGGFVAFSEKGSTRAATNGTFVGSIASGDKFYISFRWATTYAEPSDRVKGYWEFTGGTGKLSGITGTGTYTANENESGGEVNWDGEYAVPEKTDTRPTK